MGSGKTSAGSALARRLDVPFVDLDLAFESMSGETIRETFERRGEAWFRERETTLLRGTASLDRAVLALGGGTFVFADNAAFVKAHGLSVFLDAPFEVIAGRLLGKTFDRPLFRSLDEARSLYDARLPYYKMADWTIEVTAKDDVETVVDRIERVLTGGVGSGVDVR
ncbi:MAG: shikimate kinase [Thermoanaerobaculia bacterium]